MYSRKRRIWDFPLEFSNEKQQQSNKEHMTANLNSPMPNLNEVSFDDDSFAFHKCSSQTYSTDCFQIGILPMCKTVVLNPLIFSFQKVLLKYFSKLEVFQFGYMLCTWLQGLQIWWNFVHTHIIIIVTLRWIFVAWNWRFDFIFKGKLRRKYLEECRLELT